MENIHPRLAELKAMYDVEEAANKLIEELFVEFKRVGKTRCSLTKAELAFAFDGYDCAVRNKAAEELRNMGFFANYNSYHDTWEIRWYD